MTSTAYQGMNRSGALSETPDEAQARLIHARERALILAGRSCGTDDEWFARAESYVAFAGDDDAKWNALSLVAGGNLDIPATIQRTQRIVTFLRGGKPPTEGQACP